MNIQQGRDKKSPAALIRVLVGCLVVFDLLAIGLAVSTLLQSRRQHVQAATMATQNLAQVLEQNLLAKVNQIDMALLAIKDEAERGDLPESGKRVDDHIQKQYPRVGILNGLRVADAQGVITGGTGLTGIQPIGIADREYFLQLRAHPETGLVITSPLLGRVSGKWVIILARRLNRADGDFAGVVYGTITLEDLTLDLRQVDVGSHGTISLRSADLSLLVRLPLAPGQEQRIGDRTIKGGYLRAVQGGQLSSSFTEPSILDGTVRTYSMRRVMGPGFLILVGLAQDDYLDPWRREALLVALTVVGILLLSGILVRIAGAAWRRQLRDKALLAREEQKYRLLAENALDVIWAADADGLLTYVSPSFQQRPALPDELSGITSGSHQSVGRVQEQLWERLVTVKALPAGSQPFEQEVLELALRGEGGDLLETEVRVRVLWAADGSLAGFQGVTRDITRRKAAEAALRASETRFRTLFYDAPVGHALNRLEDGRFLEVNPTYAAITGYSLEELNALTYFDLTPESYAADEAVQLEALRSTGRYGPYEKEYIHKDGRRISVVLNGGVVHDADGTALILSVAADISERKRGEREREQLIKDLQHALEEVRTLGGLLPICAHCKKIRDDGGYWKQIEAYISEHSEASFTHGICPDCAQTYFPSDKRGSSE